MKKFFRININCWSKKVFWRAKTGQELTSRGSCRRKMKAAISVRCTNWLQNIRKERSTVKIFASRAERRTLGRVRRLWKKYNEKNIWKIFDPFFSYHLFFSAISPNIWRERARARYSQSSPSSVSHSTARRPRWRSFLLADIIRL